MSDTEDDIYKEILDYLYRMEGIRPEDIKGNFDWLDNCKEVKF